MVRSSLWRCRHREITTLTAATLALVASLAAGTATGWIDKFFYDLSLTTHGNRPGTGGEPVAVIAIDRNSLASEELANTPRVLYGPYWAKLIDGLTDAQVKAIGLRQDFEVERRCAGPSPYARLISLTCWLSRL